jgi:hypothetical protein
MSFASSTAVPGANARTATGDELPEIVVEVCLMIVVQGIMLTLTSPLTSKPSMARKRSNSYHNLGH